MGVTLPETNSSPLKMHGWNTIVSFWDGLSGAFAVSFRDGKNHHESWPGYLFDDQPVGVVVGWRWC